MTQSLNLDIKHLLQALWRRRWLFAVPLMLMIPLSLLFATFGPKTYIAKALIVLQESGRDNPLVKSDDSITERMKDRIDGLKALIQSDRVLRAVMKDVLGPSAPTDESKIAAWTQDFSKRIGLELRGNDFVELSLKDSQPRGMGRQVQSLTLQLLDALLAEQNATSAIQLLMDRHRTEVAEAEKAYVEYRAKIDGNVQPSQRAEVAAIKQQLQERSEALAKATSDAEALFVRTQVNAAGLVGEIERLTANLKPFESTVSPSADVAAARERLTALQQQREQESWKVALAAEVGNLRSKLKALAIDPDRNAATDPTAVALSQAVETARAQYQDYARRYTAASSSSLGVLAAPERIRVIDMPTDPLLPAVSGFKFAAAGILAGLALAFGLVIGAEIIDPKVRHAKEFEQLIGAPIVATLS